LSKAVAIRENDLSFFDRRYRKGVETSMKIQVAAVVGTAMIGVPRLAFDMLNGQLGWPAVKPELKASNSGSWRHLSWYFAALQCR
jgi:hypothetical protein